MENNFDNRLAMIGETIKDIKLIVNDYDKDELVVSLLNGRVFKIWDDGQCCCENRYMRTDDKLEEYIGAIILKIEIADGVNTETEDGDLHQIQFLRIHTNEGIIVFSNHNEHNGCYGGFDVEIKEV